LYGRYQAGEFMKVHSVRTRPSSEQLARSEQLAWRIAEVAADPAPVDPDAQDMVVNRVIDNASVAAASLNRAPVVAARGQALDHPTAPGAAVFGITGSYSPEWAAWANGVAVRELD